MIEWCFYHKPGKLPAGLPAWETRSGGRQTNASYRVELNDNDPTNSSYLPPKGR